MRLFREAFEGKYAQLGEEIVVSIELWTQLRSKKVLRNEQIEDCTSATYVCHY